MRSAQATGIIAETIELAEVDSTNRYALDAGRPGLLVSARVQTAGRGRRGRSWFSPVGENLYMTLTASPPEERYPIIAGVAVRSALSVFMPEQTIEIKWPNDVIISGRKVCGVLCEARGAIVAIGIGVNVNRSEWPEDLEHRAISMQQAAGRAFSVDEVKIAVADSFCSWMGIFLRDGFGLVREEFLRHGLLVGHEVFDETGSPCRIVGMTMEGLLVISVQGRERAIVHEPVSLGWDRGGSRYG